MTLFKKLPEKHSENTVSGSAGKKQVADSGIPAAHEPSEEEASREVEEIPEKTKDHATEGDKNISREADPESRL